MRSGRVDQPACGPVPLACKAGLRASVAGGVTRRLVGLLAVFAVACASGQPARRPAESTAKPSWTKFSPAPTGRTEVTAASTGSRIFITGGFVQDQSTVATVEIYSVPADRFVTGPNLPVAVNHAMSAAVAGVVYVMGGYLQGLADITNRAFAFRKGKWEELPAMPEPRAAAGAAAIGGKLYVAGGVGPNGLADSTFVFDTASNTWSTAPGLTTRREHLGVAAFSGRLYAVGGRAPDNLATAEVFDPPSGKWSPLPDMPTARGGLAAAATSNGLIVAPGGEEPAGTFADVEAFDISRKKWLQLPSLPTSRHGLGVAAAGTTVYVIAGGPQPGFSFSNANESIDLAPLRRE